MVQLSYSMEVEEWVRVCWVYSKSLIFWTLLKMKMRYTWHFYHNVSIQFFNKSYAMHKTSKPNQNWNSEPMKQGNQISHIGEHTFPHFDRKFTCHEIIKFLRMLIDLVQIALLQYFSHSTNNETRFSCWLVTICDKYFGSFSRFSFHFCPNFGYVSMKITLCN